jgi:uncharacterized protein (DUF2342 family)
MGLVGAAADLRTADLREPSGWDAVVTAAAAVSPAGRLGDRSVIGEVYAAEIATLRDRIRTRTDLAIELPEAIAVCDRHDWLEMMGRLVGRITAGEAGAALVAGPTPIAAGGYAGMLGLLSRRVLGQVDPGLFGGAGLAGLYIVEPNLQMAAQRFDAEPGVLRRWILAHELVHIAQFTSAPWLIDHQEDRLTAVLRGAADGRVDAVALGQLQRLMTVIEGHAEWQMDALLDEDVSALRRAVDRRRRAPDPLTRLLGALVGLDQKLAQYVTGRAFFTAVAESSVRPTRVFDDPAAVPTTAELTAPDRWVARMGG